MQKKNFIPQSANRYEQEFEYMFSFSKGKLKTFNPIMVPSLQGGREYNLKRKGYARMGKNEGSQRRRDEIVVIKDTKVPGNIFRYGCGSNRSGHPAPFPDKLVRDQIISWSNEQDLIYDPFMGSGTTAIVAQKLNRRFIGSEISEEYFEIINKRIHQNKDLFT